MKHAAPIVALGGAGLLAHHLAGPSLAKPSPEREQLAKLAGVMPCGVAEVDAEVHGETGGSFASRWSIQKASLIAQFGERAFTGLPVLDRECLLAWGKLWDDIHGRAAGRSSKVRNDPEVRDKLGKLRTEITLAALSFDDDQLPIQTRRIAIAALRLASRIDGAIDTDTKTVENNAGTFFEDMRDNFTGGVGKIAEGVGDGLAFTIESVFAPIVGAGTAATIGVVSSSIAPYLAIGGAAYYLSRKK